MTKKVSAKKKTPKPNVRQKAAAMDDVRAHRGKVRTAAARVQGCKTELKDARAKLKAVTAELYDAIDDANQYKLPFPEPKKTAKAKVKTDDATTPAKA